MIASALTVINIALIQALAIVGMWWLSGWDPDLAGGGWKDLVRRGFRCLASTALAWVFFVFAPIDYLTIPLILLVMMVLLIFWRGPIIEVFSHGFRGVVGISTTDRPVDTDEVYRQMETLGALIRQGRNAEAARFAKVLQASGANPLVMEALLDRAGISIDHGKESAPLKQARRLRMKRKFGAAEILLKALIRENPANQEATMLLIRLYAQDLRQKDKALAVLQKLRMQPQIPPEVIEFADRSIEEWAQEKPAESVEPLPESVDGLLAGGYLGTAIEILEDRAAARPDDFDAQLKLVEAHSLYSRDLQRAKKIILAMEKRGRFSEEQMRVAKDQLAGWGRAPSPRK